MRSVFVPWGVALGESERLLGDLSRYTRVDGIELLDFQSQIEKANYGAGISPALRVLSSSQGLGLELPVVGREEFKSAQRFMGEARSRGFRVTCNFVPMWSASDSFAGAALLDVADRRLTGPGDFPVHGCPNNPHIQRFGEHMMREFVRAWPDMEIMALNHLEYPWRIRWTNPKIDVGSLFSCFCEACERSAEEQGLDFSRMKGEAKSLLATLTRRWSGGGGGAPLTANADDVTHFFLGRPYLAEWLRFRMDSMTRYSRALIAAGREAAGEHNPKLRFGMEFQLPSLSPILGTDYLALSSDLDLIIPKFPDYLPGSVIPLFAKEVAARVGLDEGALLRFIREAFDLGPGPRRYTAYGEPKHILLYSNAYDYSIFARQMKYLQPLIGKVPIQPYIWENNNDSKGLRRKIEALASSGFDDFFLWSWGTASPANTSGRCKAYFDRPESPLPPRAEIPCPAVKTSMDEGQDL